MASNNASMCKQKRFGFDVEQHGLLWLAAAVCCGQQ
jgi:hypothetical protein